MSAEGSQRTKAVAKEDVFGHKIPGDLHRAISREWERWNQIREVEGGGRQRESGKTGS